ncbi:MAG: hypothetical protein II401_06875 [Bacteroidales bacterium]|nr:hypothetical protein [Bacteroidales bacterium]
MNWIIPIIAGNTNNTIVTIANKNAMTYLNPCDNAFELRKGIEKFMQYYNTERHHQGIDNEIPERKYENNKLLIRTHKAA